MKTEIPNEYPLYNVCLKEINGTEKVIRRFVGLRKGIEAIKKFDRLLASNRPAVKDYLYCYLMPLTDIIPHYDEEQGIITYSPEQLHLTSE